MKAIETAPALAGERLSSPFAFQVARAMRTRQPNCFGGEFLGGGWQVSAVHRSRKRLSEFACDDNGVTSFNRVRYRRHDESIFLYAFDLIELNGDDLRRDPLEGRKATLELILAKSGTGIRFNEHMEGDGETVFRHACKLGLEGIVSKRKDSAYRSGRSPDWLKMKNADAPAVKRREEEEEWGRRK